MAQSVRANSLRKTSWTFLESNTFHESLRRRARTSCPERWVETSLSSIVSFGIGVAFEGIRGRDRDRSHTFDHQITFYDLLSCTITRNVERRTTGVFPSQRHKQTEESEGRRKGFPGMDLRPHLRTGFTNTASSVSFSTPSDRPAIVAHSVVCARFGFVVVIWRRSGTPRSFTFFCSALRQR
jgi:hypothetical protein